MPLQTKNSCFEPSCTFLIFIKKMNFLFLFLRTRFCWSERWKLWEWQTNSFIQQNGNFHFFQNNLDMIIFTNLNLFLKNKFVNIYLCWCYYHIVSLTPGFIFFAKPSKPKSHCWKNSQINKNSNRRK